MRKVTLKNAFGFGCVVFLLGGIISLFFARQVQLHNTQLIQESLDQQASQAASKVITRLQLFEYGLKGLVGLYTSNQPELVSLQALRKYAQARDFDSEFTGSRGFGFIRWVKPEQESAYIQSWLAQRPEGFQIRELSPNPFDRFVIEIIEPEYRNKQAVGLDIASENNRRSAALRAARTGKPSLTDPITLVQASGAVEQGFLLLQPLYDSPSVKLLEANERLAHTVGWTYTPLVISEVLQGAGVNAKDVHCDLSAQTDTDTTWQVFYQNQTDAVEASKYSSVEQFTLFGRHWRLSARPGNNLVEGLNLLPPLVVLGLGLLGSLLLATLMTLGWAHRHTKIQRLRDKAHLSAVVSGSADGILGCDDNGVIRWANSSTEKFLGIDVNRLEGSKFVHVFSAECEDTSLQQLFESAVAGQRYQRGEALVKNHLTGEYMDTLLTLTPIHSDNGQFMGIAVHLTDISSQKQAQRLMEEYQANLQQEVSARTLELEAAREEAVKANQAKSEFLANMSHEIRTPLSAVLGISFLLQDGKLEKAQKEWVDKIQTAGKTLLSIVNNVLDLSKIEAGEIVIEKRRFNLHQVLHEITDVLAPQVRDKKLNFELNIQEGIADFVWLSDETRIKQVLLNLLGNAIKFTDAGSVSLTAKSDINESVSNKRQLVIEVKDSGIGMNEAAMKKLFTAFNQADSSISRRFGGTGLGLAIVKQIVEKLGGEVQVSSEEGQGSCFTIRLEIEVEQILVSEEEAMATSADDFVPLRILLGTQNHIRQKEFETNCRAFGWSVASVNSEEQFTEVFKSASVGARPFDCILLDGSEISSAALKVLDSLNVEHSTIRLPKVVLISPSGNAAELKAWPQHEFISGYVSYPIEQSELFNEISHAVNLSEGSEERVYQGSKMSSDTKVLDNIRLLLVDDHRLNIQINSAILAKYGASVTTCSDGQEACDWLESHAHEVDVVLMDMQMPNMDGCSATRFIRQDLRLTELPIIALTAGALTSQRDAALNAGMTTFLTKPLDIDKTCLTIRKLCQRNTSSESTV